MSYVELLKADATEEYRFGMLLFGLDKLKKPPTLPRILRDG
jgi:hypothetical protein